MEGLLPGQAFIDSPEAGNDIDDERCSCEIQKERGDWNEGVDAGASRQRADEGFRAEIGAEEPDGKDTDAGEEEEGFRHSDVIADLPDKPAGPDKG